jgi:hypothetical protein
MQRENSEFSASGDIWKVFRNFKEPALLRKIGRPPPHYP